MARLGGLSGLVGEGGGGVEERENAMLDYCLFLGDGTSLNLEIEAIEELRDPSSSFEVLGDRAIRDWILQFFP